MACWLPTALLVLRPALLAPSCGGLSRPTSCEGATPRVRRARGRGVRAGGLSPTQAVGVHSQVASLTPRSPRAPCVSRGIGAVPLSRSRPDGGIGRRRGLKPPGLSGLVGSNPTPGTTHNQMLRSSVVCAVGLSGDCEPEPFRLGRSVTRAHRNAVAASALTGYDAAPQTCEG